MVNLIHPIKRSYALSWKHCQEDSLNLHYHRYKIGVAASFQRSRIHKPHAHTQAFNVKYRIVYRGDNFGVQLIEDWELSEEDKVESPPEKERKNVETSVNKARCKYHQRERMVNGTNHLRVNHNATTVPKAVLLRTRLKLVNYVRPVNPKRNFFKKINIAKEKVNTARLNSTLLNAVRANKGKTIKASACWVWRPIKLNSASIFLKKHTYIDARGHSHKQIEDQGYFKSGCSRHMTKNISYLTDFKEFDRGYVALGEGAKGGKITSKGTIRTATKDETSRILKSFITEIENLVDKKVKIIKCDNGTEFKNRVMNEFCEEKDIKKEYNVARTPQENGVAKRRNRTLIEANKVLVVRPYFKTPYELFRGRTHALTFMRPFGCHVTILNTLDHLGKFDDKSDEGFFVGYSTNSDGPKWLFDINTLTESMNYVPISACTNFNDFVGKEESFDARQSSMNEGPSQDYILMPLWNDSSLFDSSLKDSDGENLDTDGSSTESKIDNQERPNNENSTKDINTVEPSINTTSLYINTASPTVNTVRLSDDYFGANNDMRSLDVIELDISNHSTTYPVPTTPNTRINKDHSLDNLIGDMQSGVQTRRMTLTTDEQGFISAIYEVKTHTLVDLPRGKRVIGTKWVFQNKQDERGIIIRNKARLVAQGCTQEEGIDYDEVFTLVARIKAIRLFLAYASFMGFLVYQMDVKSAFLYERIEEEVYVCQHLGFKDPGYPDKVYKVEKAIYGLHQAPRAWYATLAKYLLDTRFHRGKIDQTLFIKRQKDDILLVQVYVDDIIFGSTKKELCTEFEVLMHDKFQMSSMEELTFFLGLQVKHKSDGIFISQDKYMDKILRKFKYEDVKPASTLMDKEKSLLKDLDGNDIDVHLYRSMIGYLTYLTSSRPDIMFDVYTCAKFQVTLKCKKQTMVATSTTEAEYVAAASCYGQVLWIQNQLLDYGISTVHC
nr:hypothetical protein [Tanacetum cinerariifolium]